MGLRYDPDQADTNSTVYESGRITATAAGVSAQVGGSPAEGRQFVYLENVGTSVIYYGPAGLATTEMASLSKKQFVTIAATEGIGITIKTASGTSDVIVQELG